MKYLKQKLMAAVAMLVISTIMLTSASYAWFTISTAPEVQGVTTEITVNQNFEIALGTTDDAEPDPTSTEDTGDDHKWGATIAAIENLEGLGPAIAEVGDATLQTVSYGDDGRPVGLDEVDIAAVEDGLAQITDPEGNVIGQTILVWLRTNVGGAAYVEVQEFNFGEEAGDDENLINVAFEINDEIVAIADNDTPKVGLGDLAENVAIPVYIHIYLNGEIVQNKHIGAETTVSIDKILFTNSASDAYENN